MRPVILAATLCAVDITSIAAQAPAIDRANMDTTCSACSDFFAYANGSWLRTAQIPASRTSLGSFGMLSDRNEAVVHRILDDDDIAVRAATARPGTNEWKIGTFYASCMDTAGIAARGILPLRPTLDAVAGIKTTADLARVFGASERRSGIAPSSSRPSRTRSSGPSTPPTPRTRARSSGRRRRGRRSPRARRARRGGGWPSSTSRT